MRTGRPKGALILADEEPLDWNRWPIAPDRHCTSHDARESCWRVRRAPTARSWRDAPSAAGDGLQVARSVWTKSADEILAIIARFAQRTVDARAAQQLSRTTVTGLGTIDVSPTGPSR